ncbi:MAG: N-acetylglucosamine-6-phosphate deacetylase [Sediminibacterium sp.]
MSDKKIYLANRLFTGDTWLSQHAVVVERGVITDIVPATAVQGLATLQYAILAPAFVDIQIYGAQGRLLAVYPEAASLEKLYQYCVKGGASHFQPTVATNTYDVFYRCIDAVRAYRKGGGKGCLGLHIEGPWINPLKKGAHLASFIHSPVPAEAAALLEYGKGVISMITLAPEVCSREVLELIQAYGVVLSAGHTNATYEEATNAFDTGIPAATHLYNAMSPLQHRAPGMVGAVFNHGKVMASIVPDGHHVDFAAIRIAKHQLKERLFVITDAVTETSEGPYPHQQVGDKYEAGGILSGSALTMGKCVYNLVNHADIELDEALRMASLYPAQVMGKDHRIGRIAKGYDANLVCLNEALEIESVEAN